MNRLKHVIGGAGMCMSDLGDDPAARQMHMGGRAA